MRVAVAVLCLLAIAVQDAVARKSEFRKEIDMDALEKNYADEAEDDDWHEDTFEWKEKEQERKRKEQPPIDFSKMKDGKLDASQMQNVMAGMGGGGGMKMMFATVNTKTKKEAEELGRRWPEMLRNGGILVKAYVVEDDSILLTEDNGQTYELKKFILEQPETLAFRIDNSDFYPEGERGEKARALLEEKKKKKAPPPPKTASKKKKKKNKKKKKKKKAEL